ncbi:MAG: hypothetical protein Q8P40_01000 [Nitrospirota bacterium]|nr:hypothetical protein [Nitrospirota bacterium]
MRNILLVAVAIGILCAGIATAAVPDDLQQQKKAGTLGVPNPVPGDMFSGNYLRIGINNAGTLGITNGSNTGDPGVGFQSVNDTPFQFPSTESAAIWWWGEGYNIAYKLPGLVDRVAYWQPGYGYPPGASSNISLVSSNVIINDRQKAVKEVVVRTRDNNLRMTFTFTFLKDYPELNLETTITNTGRVTLRDIVYKRIIDWDVCTDTYNNWTSTAEEAYAWGYCKALKEFPPLYNNMVQVTIAGNKGVFTNGKLTVDDSVLMSFPLFDRPLPIVNYVDLYAWDDHTVRKPMNVLQSFVPVRGDYDAGVYYKIGELNPKKSKTVYTVYQSNFPMITMGTTGAEAPEVVETIDKQVEENVNINK